MKESILSKRSSKLPSTLCALAMLAFGASSAQADFTMVIPQKPGGGTSVWAQIVAKELSKKLGESITLRHIAGARDIPGFNEFQNELQFDDDIMMVSHGGNGVSFLQEKVDYDYSNYSSIGMMNLTIVLGKWRDMEKISFAAGSGNVPDGIALALLTCGPDKSVEAYKQCFDEEVLWVNGMSSGERRLAFLRKELTVTRENPAAYKKHVQPLIEEGNVETWFTHGLLDKDSGNHVDDPNFPGLQFEKVFERTWGVAPSGELYDAYKLVKSYRDALQKAIWVRKGNPNTERLRRAMTEMINDPESTKVFHEKVGKYEWIVGDDGDKVVAILKGLTTRNSLTTLIEWNRSVFGLDSVFKESLVN